MCRIDKLDYRNVARRATLPIRAHVGGHEGGGHLVAVRAETIVRAQVAPPITRDQLQLERTATEHRRGRRRHERRGSRVSGARLDDDGKW